MQTHKPTRQLVLAVYHLDMSGVERALNDGADVNRPDDFTASAPVWLDLMETNDHNVTDWPKLNIIWEKITALIEKFDVFIGNPKAQILDRIVPLENVTAASLAALAVIKKSNGNARINIEENFAWLGDSENPLHPTRLKYKEKILRLHEHVRKRLLNPTTPFEKESAAALSEENKEYWLAPLVFPNLIDLPMPSQGLIDMVRLREAAIGEIGRILSSCEHKDGDRMTREASIGFTVSVMDAEFAKKAVNLLQKNGLDRTVRKKVTGLNYH